ncbi:MAG: Fur family transcriptional regulator [Sphingobacteriaceae bacterium]|nr:Fur family transcriptional regulator [Sphingobacteriaceae bacterium]
MKTSRKTVASTEIQRLIQESTVALSHVEILNRLNGLCDRVTVYRVLERLVNDDIVHKIVNVDGVLKFASCQKCEHVHVHEHNHVHFSCENCKIVVCLNDVAPKFQMPAGYVVKEMNFTVMGLCPQCA